MKAAALFLAFLGAVAAFTMPVSRTGANSARQTKLFMADEIKEEVNFDGDIPAPENGYNKTDKNK